jgi:hypothetical protein
VCDISSLRVNDLTLILLTWRKWRANNASKWQMGFNSAFKGLKVVKNPGNGRLNNLNDPVLNVLIKQFIHSVIKINHKKLEIKR